MEVNNSIVLQVLKSKDVKALWYIQLLLTNDSKNETTSVYL
jgi:hypothetical protein